MRLIWHSIKKDIRRVAWGLVIWALTGGCLIAYKQLDVAQHSIWDNLGIVSLFTHTALVFALIAAIVQEDGLTGDNEFWRTRPISGARLLAAKVGLIVPVFVIIPTGLTAMQSWVLNHGFNLSALIHLMSAMGVIILSLMAMAACTKDLGRYVLGGMLCVIGVIFLGPRLVPLIDVEPLPKAMMSRVGLSRIFAIFTLCGFASLFILLNQYLTRRTVVSVGIIATTVVGVILIGSYWRWHVFF